MTGFFPVPKPKPIFPPKAPKPMRKVNTARKAMSFARCYGSRARQKWVNLQPCAACGAWGRSANAHVLGVDGARMKGPYREIAPLCDISIGASGTIYPGCHALFDEHQDEFRAKFPTFNAKKAARDTQKAWLAFLNSASTGET